HMLKEDRKYYFPLLLIFLCLNDIFDSYCTNYPNSYGSFIELEFGITHSVYLIIVGIASIGTYFVFFNQYLCDLLGRRIMIFIVLLGLGLSSLFISLSTTPLQYTIGLFFIYIFFSSDVWVIYLSEQSSEKHRAGYISLVLVFGSVGGGLTIPLFRALLIPSFGWRSMTWFAYIAIGIAFLAFMFKESRIYREMKVQKKDRKGIRFNLKKFVKIFDRKIIKSTITISLLGFFVGWNYVFLISGEPYLAAEKHFDTSQIDLIITAIVLGAIIGYILAGILSDYIGRKPVICIFSVIIPLGLIMIILGNFIASFIGGFLVSISFWGLFVISRMIAIESFPTDIRGTGAGFRSFSYAVGTTVGSFFTAYILVFIGLGWSFLLNSIFLLIMIPFVILFVKETKGIKLDKITII
ncbi:MAG: MFS transporter, partial [Candidatus Helarchaeota archaeon]